LYWVRLEVPRFWQDSPLKQPCLSCHLYSLFQDVMPWDIYTKSNPFSISYCGVYSCNFHTFLCLNQPFLLLLFIIFDDLSEKTTKKSALRVHFTNFGLRFCDFFLLDSISKVESKISNRWLGWAYAWSVWKDQSSVKDPRVEFIHRQRKQIRQKNHDKKTVAGEEGKIHAKPRESFLRVLPFSFTSGIESLLPLKSKT
jgi:hypothetical protein